MKVFLGALVLGFSLSANADLANNAFAKIQYQEITILEVQSVDSKIKFVPASPNNVPYYEGYVVVNAIVEGNICTSSPVTFGTLQTLEGKIIFTKLLAANAWTPGMVGCPQYSHPTHVQFPISIGWLTDHGSGLNQSIANFKVGIMSQQVASIVVTAHGTQIKVSVKK
jgi:hypothetical protein